MRRAYHTDYAKITLPLGNAISLCRKKKNGRFFENAYNVVYPLMNLCEVSYLGTYLLAMASITYANKAKDILVRNGYRCEIQKTPRTSASGCGYSIKITGNPEEIMPILDGRGIAVRSVTRIDGAG